jgi:hypothetical protein
VKLILADRLLLSLQLHIGNTGNFVVMPQPWLTLEALTYQALGRANRNVFKETVNFDAYEEGGEPGSSKPRPDTPSWLIDQDWVELYKEEEEEEEEEELTEHEEEAAD